MLLSTVTEWNLCIDHYLSLISMKVKGSQTSMTNTVTKYCKKCGKDQEFYKSNRCKVCALKQAREWKKANPEKTREHKKTQHVKHKGNEILEKHVLRVKAVGGTSDVAGVALIRWVHDTPGRLFCHYCGVLLTDTAGPRQKNIEHLDGVKTGNRFANIQTACSSCNGRKGKKPYDDYVFDLGKSFANDNRSKDTFVEAFLKSVGLMMVAPDYELPRAA